MTEPAFRSQVSTEKLLNCFANIGEIVESQYIEFQRSPIVVSMEAKKGLAKKQFEFKEGFVYVERLYEVGHKNKEMSPDEVFYQGLPAPKAFAPEGQELMISVVGDVIGTIGLIGGRFYDGNQILERKITVKSNMKLKKPEWEEEIVERILKE